MKKTILILVAVYLFTGCSQTRNAQATTTAAERGTGTERGTTASERGSGTERETTVPERGSGANTAGLATKAVRSFWQLYGDSKNENWFHLENGSLAEFVDKDIHYRVFFDRKGNWNYTLKQYSEKVLPKDVRAMVRSIYYDYAIKQVKEVNQAQLVVYLIHIENDQEWKTIRVADGELEVAEEYVKY
jgi:hypothetical protein